MQLQLTSKVSASVATVCGLLLLDGWVTANAQSYTLAWSTLDGGGGTSTGGVYSVTGTIGQPDAGTSGGGEFTLQGGFWGVIAAVQAPGVPPLTILRTSTNTVVVSWPLPASGWVLEATSALPQLSAPWPQIDAPYQTNGTSVQFTEPLPTGHRFYRLRRR